MTGTILLKVFVLHIMCTFIVKTVANNGVPIYTLSDLTSLHKLGKNYSDCLGMLSSL
jgi:hypothetical protein